jgi:hypothetical protein
VVKLKTGTAVNPYAFAASKAAGGLIAAATSDLAVIRTQTRPRGRSPPIEYEIHLNPAALGIAAVGAALTLWLMQLRTNPYLVAEYKTVIDVPGVAAWTETIHHDGVGHQEIDVPETPEQTIWVGDQYIHGSFQAGHYVTIPGHPAIPGAWVWDVMPWDETISHPPILEVSHQEPTGKMIKKYSLEQRSGFLGNGTGTGTGPNTSDKIIEYGFGGWWSPWW